MSRFPMWRNRWLRIAILLTVPLALYLPIREQMSWRPRSLKLASSTLQSMTFSPDSQILATISTVRRQGDPQLEANLWEAQHLTLIQTLPFIESICFAPDGKTFAGTQSSSPQRASVKMFDTATKRLLWTTYLTGSNYLSALAFWPDQQTLTGTGKFNPLNLNAPDDYGLRQWATQTGKLLRVLPLPRTRNQIILAPDKATLLFAQLDWSHLNRASGHSGHFSPWLLELWSARTGQRQHTLKRRFISFIPVFSPDGQTLAVVRQLDGDMVSLWSVKTGQLLHILSPSIKDIAFMPGSHILAGSGKNGIVFWDIRTGQPVRTLAVQSNTLGKLIFSPDGHIVAGLDSVNSKVIVWDVATGKVQRTLEIGSNTSDVDNNSQVPPLFSPDSCTLAVSRTDGTILLQRVK